MSPWRPNVEICLSWKPEKTSEILDQYPTDKQTMSNDMDM
jgi:hypothetical protein